MSSSSEQSLPPFEATGLLHDRSRSENPSPQVAEHGVHSLHCPGFPSIAEITFVKRFITLPSIFSIMNPTYDLGINLAFCTFQGFLGNSKIKIYFALSQIFKYSFNRIGQPSCGPRYAVGTKVFRMGLTVVSVVRET